MTLIHAENPARDQPPARNWRRTIERAGPALLIALLVVLWQVLTRALDIPNFLLPAPTDIARLMIDEWPLIQMHSLATIGSIVSGLVGGTTGLSLGEPTDVPGIRISLAHAAAEAGGNKVMGATEEAPRQLDPQAAPIAAPALPRTGGLPIDATAIPVLLGASAGLRSVVRRRRRNA